MGWWFTGADSSSQSSLTIGSSIPAALMELLVAEDIVPGADPSYQICKIIYAYHPLGSKMADAPISLAQSQQRQLAVPSAPEEMLLDAFRREWTKLGKIGADALIHNAMKTSRIYGISALVAGARNHPTDQPLPQDQLHKLDLYFNVADPLVTAGSLVLDQDPNAPDYQKPNHLRIAHTLYHSSRCVITMNEQPQYILWTNSAFGFTGRSVYQRALYPLKSYVISMITDNSVMEKCGLIVAKMKSPGAILDQRARQFMQMKRTAIQGGKTGNVVSIGLDENLESLNFQNLDGPYKLARENMLKNIAVAANMPASLIHQETLAEGFGEGTEDAKQIAHYIDRIRIEMGPLYRFMDHLVQSIAWNPDFYRSLQRVFPEYQSKSYEAAFSEWSNAFTAEWPNLLTEPDSEKVKTDDVIMKAAIAAVEVMQGSMDPVNRAALFDWLAQVMNTRKQMFPAPLILDMDSLKDFVAQNPMTSDPESTAHEIEGGKDRLRVAT